MELYENKQEPEKAVLIAVDTGEYDCEISLDELEELELLEVLPSATLLEAAFNAAALAAFTAATVLA